MPEYRIFYLDHAGRVRGPSERIHADNDQDVVAEARKKLDDSTLEIWDGMRRMAILKPPAK